MHRSHANPFNNKSSNQFSKGKKNIEAWDCAIIFLITWTVIDRVCRHRPGNFWKLQNRIRKNKWRAPETETWQASELLKIKNSLIKIEINIMKTSKLLNKELLFSRYWEVYQYSHVISFNRLSSFCNREVLSKSCLLWVGSTKFASRTPKEIILNYCQALIAILNKIHLNIIGKEKKTKNDFLEASHQPPLCPYCLNSSQQAKMAALQEKEEIFQKFIIFFRTKLSKIKLPLNLLHYQVKRNGQGSKQTLMWR